MRHHNGDSPICIGECGNALRRSVGVAGIGFGNIAGVVDKAQRDHLLYPGGLCLGAKVDPSFAVGNHHGQVGPVHTGQQDRGVLRYLDHDIAGLKLFRLIADESGPELGTGYQLLQAGQHLASVAHPQRKCIVLVEIS